MNAHIVTEIKDKPPIVDSLARWERMRDPPWPKLAQDHALYNAAGDFGFVLPDGRGGQRALSLAEVIPAVTAPGSPIVTYGDAVMVTKISEAFLEGLTQGQNPLSIPPWRR